MGRLVLERSKIAVNVKTEYTVNCDMVVDFNPRYLSITNKEREIFQSKYLFPKLISCNLKFLQQKNRNRHKENTKLISGGVGKTSAF